MFEKEILEVYQKSNTSVFPIDCDKILNAYGYRVKTYISAVKTTGDLKSLQRYSNDAFTQREKKLIFYNDSVCERRIRFSKMHELGHIVLETDDDMQADAFASHILAPRPVIFAKKLRTADQISKEFNISISAANQSLVSGFYVPDKDGRAIIKHFGFSYLCPELFWDPEQKPKTGPITFRVPRPVPPSYEDWKTKTIEIKNALADIESKIFLCKSDRRYKTLQKKHKELLIRERWQDEAGERYGYELTMEDY